MGVFFDHTFSSFDENPNTPAGSSETLQRIRGESYEVAPLLPEKGNVWPGPSAPDPTLQDLEAQQNTGAPPPVVAAEQTTSSRARCRRRARRPPPQQRRKARPCLTPRGPSQDVGGQRPQLPAASVARADAGHERHPGAERKRHEHADRSGWQRADCADTALMLRVLYFAWLRERTGRAEETIPVTGGCRHGRRPSRLAARAGRGGRRRLRQPGSDSCCGQPGLRPSRHSNRDRRRGRGSSRLSPAADGHRPRPGRGLRRQRGVGGADRRARRYRRRSAALSAWCATIRRIPWRR